MNGVEPTSGASKDLTAGASPSDPSGVTLLRLMQLASPALPVGGFSYSEGLESAVDAGRVTGEADAAAWLIDQLHLGLARSDLPTCARAFDAWRCAPGEAALSTLRSLNDWFTTTRETQELRRQTQQMGRSLTEWLKNRDALDGRVAVLDALVPAPTWPVAFALAAAETGAACRDAVLTCGFGWAENMVQAALKAVPLGQSAGQRVLAALMAELPVAVDHAIGIADVDRQAFSPMLAILSSRHETQYSRLFRS